MHLGYVYGIVERDSGKQHICIYSRSLAETSGTLYEIRDNTISPFEFTASSMDVLLEIPFADYFQHCQIDQKYPLQQVIDIVEERNLTAVYNRYIKDIQKEKDHLAEWNARGKEGRQRIKEKIKRLQSRLDDFLSAHPDITKEGIVKKVT